MYRLLNKAITEFHCYTLCSRCFSWHELHPWGFGSFSVSCCVQQTHLQGRERIGHLCTRIIWVAALWHLVVQGHWRAGLCQNATRNSQNGINNRFAAAQATGLLPAAAAPQSVLSPSRGASKEQTTIRFLQLWVTRRSDKTQPTKRNRAPSHPVRRFSLVPLCRWPVAPTPPDVPAIPCHLQCSEGAHGMGLAQGCLQPQGPWGER